MYDDSLFKIISDVEKKQGFSFAENTTYACGGKAKIAYFPQSITQAVAVYDYLTDKEEKFVVLGNGSNVLASDSGFDGAVICTKSMKGISLSQNLLFCYAGTTVSELLKFCKKHGCGGLEYLVGIPASIGGLACMNGGAAGRYICENILNVMIYDGTIRKLSDKNCNFGNKYSTMRSINALILGVELSFVPQTRENIQSEIRKYLDKRKFQPKGASCGCVFKNENGKSSGKIIDDCGLKGLRFGGAYVSYDHANFIINGGGTASDVHTLIEIVKNKVYEKTGIRLNEEVVYIGDF